MRSRPPEDSHQFPGSNDLLGCVVLALILMAVIVIPFVIIAYAVDLLM